MEPADLESVQALDRLSFSSPWPANAYRFELVENNQSWLWVAVDLGSGEPEKGKVVGVVVLWLILDEAHIATIAVHPDYRGRGIGQQLLVEALKEGFRQGAETATLEVRAGNLAAQNLYHRFRFETVGRRVRYYRDNNEDALIMSLSRLDHDYLRWLESRAWAGRTLK